MLPAIFSQLQSRVFSRISTLPKANLYIWAASLILLLFYAWLALWDPFYRTVFVEEMNGGEAGRTAFLFNHWVGEGGDWQSAPYEVFGSAMVWLGLEAGGLSRFSMRLPFVFLSTVAFGQFAILLKQISSNSPWLLISTCLALVLSPFIFSSCL